MSCSIKVNSNTIELTVHTSCYCALDLLCVTRFKLQSPKSRIQTDIRNPFHVAATH